VRCAHCVIALAFGINKRSNCVELAFLFAVSFSIICSGFRDLVLLSILDHFMIWPAPTIKRFCCEADVGGMISKERARKVLCSLP